jgi:WD40 repeat protein
MAGFALLLYLSPAAAAAGIISCLCFSPVHSDLLAAGSYSRCIGLFDARTYEQLLLLEGHKGGLTQVSQCLSVLTFYQSQAHTAGGM